MVLVLAKDVLVYHRHTYFRKQTWFLTSGPPSIYWTTVLKDYLLKKGVPEKFINILNFLYTTYSNSIVILRICDC